MDPVVSALADIQTEMMVAPSVLYEVSSAAKYVAVDTYPFDFQQEFL